MLIILGGLPGVGKTSVARELARRAGAVYLRIDSIEQALRAPIEDTGYRVAYAVAEDNLRLGRTVVADSVNPIALTRSAWLDVARRAETPTVEIEIVCSDAAEHRRRVESRNDGVTWDAVVAREYAPWPGARTTIDTAGRTLEECIELALACLPKTTDPKPRS
jgi:predicted kinase